MGFKTVDLVPFNLNAPVITPVSKDVQVKGFQVNRTDTTAVLKLALPADASALWFQVFVPTASNATSTAAISFTGTAVNGTVIVPTLTQSVLATGFFQLSSGQLPNIESPSSDQQGDIYFTASYAETGTASTAGGPFTVLVYFIR